MTEGSDPRLQPLPVTLITGFLGAGKTTTLNRWLKDRELHDTIVLINEFGDIALDHNLIESVEDDHILLASGCICCTVRGDLIDRLEDLLRQRDNNRIRPFARLMIETTGLANPLPVITAIWSHPYLSKRYLFDKIITLVDSLNGLNTLQHHHEARMQVAVSDHILISKTDLAAPQEDLIKTLSVLSPAATIKESHQTSANLVTETHIWSPNTKRLPEGWEDQRPHHHHHHDTNEHSKSIRGFPIVSDKALSKQDLAVFQDILRALIGPKLLRVKGLILTDEEPEKPLLVQGAQQHLQPFVRLEAWPNDKRQTQLMFIGQNLDPRLMETLKSTLFGLPSLDQPDANTLMDNPLAPSTFVAKNT